MLTSIERVREAQKKLPGIVRIIKARNPDEVGTTPTRLMSSFAYELRRDLFRLIGTVLRPSRGHRRRRDRRAALEDDAEVLRRSLQATDELRLRSAVVCDRRAQQAAVHGTEALQQDQLVRLRGGAGHEERRRRPCPLETPSKKRNNPEPAEASSSEPPTSAKKTRGAQEEEQPFEFFAMPGYFEQHGNKRWGDHRVTYEDIKRASRIPRNHNPASWDDDLNLLWQVSEFRFGENPIGNAQWPIHDALNNQKRTYMYVQINPVGSPIIWRLMSYATDADPLQELRARDQGLRGPPRAPRHQSQGGPGHRSGRRAVARGPQEGDRAVSEHEGGQGSEGRPPSASGAGMTILNLREVTGASSISSPHRSVLADDSDDDNESDEGGGSGVSRHSIDLTAESELAELLDLD